MMNKASWLFALLVPPTIVVIFLGLLLGFEALRQPQLDIQMHNVYIVVPPYALAIGLALPLWLVAGLLVVVYRRTQAGFYGFVAVGSAVALGAGSCTLYRLAVGSTLALNWTTHLPMQAPSFTESPSNHSLVENLLFAALAAQLLAATLFGLTCFQLGRLKRKARVTNR